MKFTINVCDGMVAIDGKQTSGVPTPQLDSDVICVHWFGDYGDEHYVDQGIRKVRRVFDAAKYTPILADASELLALETATESREPTYADLRAAEYPDSREYLDGVVKGDQAQIDAYIAACNAVKAKYPKPE